MSYIITFIVGLLSGALVGVFAYRNNLAKAQALEAKAKAGLDAIKAK